MKTQKYGRWRALPMLVLTGAMAAGCEGPTGPPAGLGELPRPLTSMEQGIIDGSNKFAFDLFDAVNISERDRNVFISPLSVSMALGMTMNGAAASTYDQMRATLGFDGLSEQEINDAYRGLIDLLLGLDSAVEIGIANSVWYRQDFPFEASFLDVVQESFDAEVESADFANPQTLPRINGWVSDATRGRIDTIIEAIDPRDVMYLINAIYFKGDWRQQFDPDATAPAPFTRLDGGTVEVPMMHTDGTFGYSATAQYEAVDLPYGNGSFLMTVLLPRAGEDINDVLGALDASRWAEITGGMQDRDLTVSLPRFRLEFSKSLVEPLRALGMVAPFESADFTRMSPRGGELVISEVKHKSFVDVNEEGTEAAAVTSVTMRLTSASPGIRVDRPFIFAIRERFSGTILFSGKIVDPTASGD